MDREDPEKKIVRLIKEGAKPKQARRKASLRTVEVKGDGNITAGRDINLNPVIRPRVVVKSGDGTLDGAQKAEIQRLIYEWVDARQAVRRSSFSIPAAWTAFKNKFGVNKYDEIPMEQFGAARAWLQRQIAIIGSMASAPGRMPNWRTKAIASIKARCKNQLRDVDAYRSYIMEQFGKQSLTELDDDELQRTKAYVFGRRLNGP